MNIVPFRRAGGEHGCSPPVNDMQRTDSGDWTCPTCGALWRVWEILCRRRGSGDPWEPGLRMGIDLAGMEFRFTWRLVKSGQRTAPDAGSAVDQNVHRVKFIVTWMPWNRIAVTRTRNNDTFSAMPQGGRWVQTLVAIPGSLLRLSVRRAYPLPSPRYLNMKIYVDGVVRAELLHKKPLIEEMEIHYRIPPASSTKPSR